MADLLSPQEIAKRLRELQRTSPTDRADLEGWNASAQNFWRELGIPLPSGVAHYLHDADIRIKDPLYRLSQDEMLSDIISELERGRIPQSSGVTIHFHPRWLGVIALLVLALAYLVFIRSAA